MNYERRLESEDDMISEESEEYNPDDEDEDDNKVWDKSAKYRTFTYDHLFKLVLKYCPDSYLPKIRAIAGFHLLSSENFIQSLLLNRQDVVACDQRVVKEYEQDLLDP